MAECSFRGCHNAVLARTWCGTHYRRWRIHGSPEIVHPKGNPPIPLAERFWAKVEKTDSCWLWRGADDGHGYGGINIDKVARKAHRVAWELENGPIPRGLFVLHHCDNPPCVRVSHLFLGTASDNNADMTDKGRRRSRNHIPRERALAIHAEYAQGGVTQRALSAKYGISQHTISQLTRRRTWHFV